MDRKPHPSIGGLEQAFLLVAGTVGAGVHAGLAPEHLHEWPALGGAFIAAAAALSIAVAALAARPAGPWPPRVLALLLGGLIVAYTATRLVALPPLDPTREPLDALGVATSAIEATGLLLALHLGRRAPIRRRLPFTLSPGGTTE